MTSKLISFRKYLSIVCIIFFSLELCVVHAHTSQIEFPSAFQYVLENAMRLKAAQAEMGIRNAERLQAGYYPNPDLTIGFDDIGRSYDGNENEISVGLTQLFELGGKRMARLRVADAAQCETSWDFEILKCDLYTELLHAFIETATAQESLSIAVDLENIAERSCKCINEKFIHGKGSIIDAKKSEIAYKSARLMRLKRTSELEKAKIQLASLYNGKASDFEKVNFPLFDISPPPPLENLEKELANNPELAKSHAEIAKAWEIIEVERTRQTPDIALYVGVSSEKFYREPALSVGIDITLPIFNRNQANVSRASHEYNQMLFKQIDLTIKFKTKIAIIYKEWCAAYEQAAALMDILATTAEETFQLAQESYELGNSEYLEFLDARAMIFNMKQHYLDAIEECNHKHAEILKLTAKCCKTMLIPGV